MWSFCWWVAGSGHLSKNTTNGSRSEPHHRSRRLSGKTVLSSSCIETRGAIFEGKPLARKDLAPKLESLAAQVRINARAVGTAQAASRELPAVILIQADAEAPCSLIFPLILDCMKSGFGRFALKTSTLRPAADRLVEARVAPATPTRENDLPAGLRIIPIQLGADDKGRLAVAEVGELQYRDFDSVRAELTSILDDPELPFDRARITVDPRLLCSELGRVMEVLMNKNVARIELSLP